MMARLRQITALLQFGFLLVAHAPQVCSAAEAPPVLPLPVEVFVPVAPIPAHGDGQTHLVYELHVTNLGPRELTLTRIETFGDERAGVPLARVEGQELSGRMQLLGTQAPPSDNRRIAGGLRAVVYMWLALEPPRAMPRTLRHRLTFAGGVDKREQTIEAGATAVRADAPIVIGPPLRGERWGAGNGPANDTPHRRALIAIDGTLHLGQRFAIDWIQLDKNGRFFAGDPKINANYPGYGAELIAVADGVVTSVKDGIPDNILDVRAVPITLETAGGNHVVLQLGNGLYALYGHLQLGSPRVKVGDKVRRGQVLGLLGSSGNSDGPHLHFQLCDANSFLECEGVPYVLESFDVQGLIDNDATNFTPYAKSVRHDREIPMKNEVVSFPGR